MVAITRDTTTCNKAYSVTLIEDDHMVSALIKSYLEKFGFSVYLVSQIEQVQNHLSQKHPDLIIFDVGYSGMSGFQKCHMIRDVFRGPIIVLTSRDQDDEQVAAFDFGADDCLSKPVSPKILKVRVDALLRRQAMHAKRNEERVVKVGDISLYPQSYKVKVKVKGKGIRLSSFEFRLLSLLLSNAGKVMTRDQIYHILLGRHYNGVERTVDVRVSRLRDKLSVTGARRAQIETVWGKGYILNEVAA